MHTKQRICLLKISEELRKSSLERWPWKRKLDNSPSWQSLREVGVAFLVYGNHVIGFLSRNIRWHRETYHIYSSNQSWMSLSLWMYWSSHKVIINLVTAFFIHFMCCRWLSKTLCSQLTETNWWQLLHLLLLTDGHRPGGWIAQDTIRPCNPDINPEVGDLGKTSR